MLMCQHFCRRLQVGLVNCILSMHNKIQDMWAYLKLLPKGLKYKFKVYTENFISVLVWQQTVR